MLMDCHPSKQHGTVGHRGLSFKQGEVSAEAALRLMLLTQEPKRALLVVMLRGIGKIISTAVDIS